uniref:Uncharacterized protein n=1 Tax=Walleye epidermal hyperplasia virus 1 TaxID=64462 RepID=Q9WHI9_9RETR|nr:unknown [Walleye epidermal hyperplasia virus 1]
MATGGGPRSDDGERPGPSRGRSRSEDGDERPPPRPPRPSGPIHVYFSLTHEFFWCRRYLSRYDVTIAQHNSLASVQTYTDASQWMGDMLIVHRSGPAIWDMAYTFFGRLGHMYTPITDRDVFLNASAALVVAGMIESPFSPLSDSHRWEHYTQGLVSADDIQARANQTLYLVPELPPMGHECCVDLILLLPIPRLHHQLYVLNSIYTLQVSYHYDTPPRHTSLLLRAAVVVLSVSSQTEQIPNLLLALAALAGVPPAVLSTLTLALDQRLVDLGIPVAVSATPPSSPHEERAIDVPSDESD